MTRNFSLDFTALALLLAAVAAVSGAPAGHALGDLQSATKLHFKDLTRAVKVSSKTFLEASTNAGASSSSVTPSSAVAEFASDRRGLASADSISCIVVTSAYTCALKSDAASCNAESSCEWNVNEGCAMKYTPTQQSTVDKATSQLADLKKKCSNSGSCPSDSCEKVDECTPNQAGVDDVFPNDPTFAKYRGMVHICDGLKSRATCATKTFCEWDNGCGVKGEEIYKTLRPSALECNAGGTRVGSRSAAEHVANHDMCPWGLADIKCSQIKTASECAPSKTSNTCQLKTDTANDPSFAIFPCEPTDEQSKSFQNFIRSDVITLMDLFTTCSPYTTWGTCEAVADCNWDDGDGTCGPTPAKIHDAYAAHPHMDRYAKAARSCAELGETACKAATFTCVWAPPVGKAKGECLSTPANVASHVACECDTVRQTFADDLTIDPSVCTASTRSDVSRSTTVTIAVVFTMMSLALTFAMN